MKKIATAIAIAALLGSSAVVFAPAAQAGNDKIDICHATGKDGKYTTNSISKNGTANGHAGASHQDGRDIIPAYSWIENKVRYHFEGQNLDKVGLIAKGCKEPAEPVTAAPVGPTYVPASCARPELPFGEVVIPVVNGEGVVGTSVPALNADNTEWSVQYTLAADTDEIDWSWAAGTDGSYKFTVVPLTADEFWVTDSKTGEGSCVLPVTGAVMDALPYAAGAAGLGLLVFGASKIRRRRVA